jgi:hypothetical protein
LSAYYYPRKKSSTLPAADQNSNEKGQHFEVLPF